MRRIVMLLLLMLAASGTARAAEMDLFVWRAEDLDAALAARGGFTRVLMQYSSEGMPSDQLREAGLTLCLLDGGPAWSRSDMIDLVRKAADLSISCAVLDCEGWYTRQSPTEARFKRFVDRIVATHEVAAVLGVRLSVCIPHWTEKISEEQLERLIRDGCDEIIVMDYDDEKLIENLRTEARLCERFGKTCQVALQIKPPKEGEESDESAYWAGGLPALREVFERIRAAYGDKVGYSIHHAAYLADFLALE